MVAVVLSWKVSVLPGPYVLIITGSYAVDNSVGAQPVSPPDSLVAMVNDDPVGGVPTVMSPPIVMPPPILIAIIYTPVNV